jgi:hypothetical protein
MASAPTLVPGDKAWCLFALSAGASASRAAEPLPSEVRLLQWSRDHEGGLLAAVLVPVGASIQAKEVDVKLEDGTRGRAKIAWVQGAALRPARLSPTAALRFKTEPDMRTVIVELIPELQIPTEVYETASEEEKSPSEVAILERMAKVESGGRALHEEVKQQGKNLMKLTQLLEASLGRQAPASRGASGAAVKTQDPLLRGLAQHGALFSEDLETDEEDDEPELRQERRKSRRAPTGVAAPEAAAGAALGIEDPNIITQKIQLEMLKSLEKLARRGASHGDSASGSGASSDSEGLLGKRGKSKLAGVQKLRARIRKHPTRIVSRYLRKVKTKLGALEAGKVWRLSDYSTRLLPRFGKMRGLWRVHWLLSEVLQAALAEEYEYVKAYLVQILKCLHQVALDSGAWTTANLLLPTEDPLAPDEFGGEPEELQVAYNYVSALKELKSRHTATHAKQESSSNEEQDDGTKKPKKPKKPKKGADPKSAAAPEK